VLDDRSAGIHALVVWGGNPLVSAPNAGATRRGLARDDLFTVVSEQFLTDTARYADVVLPATTQLEQLDVIPSWGTLHLGWNEPAIAPLGEAVPNTELWRRLARALGIDDPLFDLDDEALLRLALHDLDVDALRARGWARHAVPDPLLPYAEGGFATADGRAALRNDALRALGLPALPTFTAPVTAADGALRLLTPKTHPRFLNSSYAHHHGPLEPAPCLELHPDDAERLGLDDGTLARIGNERGVLELPVRRSARVRPGVCAIPWGWWGEDRNVNVLTDDTLTDAGGGGSFYETTVVVAPA
jgi:anaerobic selenocysteine-containing dehydrogenase